MNLNALLSRFRADAAEICVKMNAALPLLKLNYPADSLARTLGASPAEVPAALEAAAQAVPGLTFAPFEEALCVTLPAALIREAYENASGAEFLRALAALSADPHAGEEAYTALFLRFGGRAEPVRTEEFAALLYFPSGEPDPHYYCLSRHGAHAEVHRFTREDYRAMAEKGPGVQGPVQSSKSKVQR